MHVDQWHLNNILLTHTQHFFHAAYSAAQLVESQCKHQAGLTASLAGNLLWAKSPYVSNSKEQEHDMALIGAFLGTLGGELPDHFSQPTNSLEQCISLLELELRTNWDGLLKRLLQQIESVDEDVSHSPAWVNHFVWNQLFPDYEQSWNIQHLSAQICARLGAA